MRKYDLIFSLGGNCSAASNLAQRRLRPFSLPFDWVYFRDKSTIDYLTNGFRTGFCDLMLKENLVEIRPGHSEWVDNHKGFLKFLDQKSGYRFVNHFRKPLDCDDEYDKVSVIMRRRVDRLFQSVKRGQAFLLLLATDVDVDVGQLMNLIGTLNEVFPGKRFDLEFLKFSSENTEDSHPNDHLTIRNIARNFNHYDFVRTNYEWQFLDDIRSLTKPKRQRISFHLLPDFRVEISWKRTLWMDT